MKLASFEGPYLQGSITYCKKALSECATLIWHFGVCFYLADAAVFFPPPADQCPLLPNSVH